MVVLILPDDNPAAQVVVMSDDATEPVSIDNELDVRGLTCPMPLLKAKLALNRMASGQCLRVIATDPGSQRDFEVFSRQTGHQLLRSVRRAAAATQSEEFEYVLKKR